MAQCVAKGSSSQQGSLPGWALPAWGRHSGRRPAPALTRVRLAVRHIVAGHDGIKEACRPGGTAAVRRLNRLPCLAGSQQPCVWRTGSQRTLRRLRLLRLPHRPHPPACSPPAATSPPAAGCRPWRWPQAGLQARGGRCGWQEWAAGGGRGWSHGRTSEAGAPTAAAAAGGSAGAGSPTHPWPWRRARSASRSPPPGCPAHRKKQPGDCLLQMECVWAGAARRRQVPHGLLHARKACRQRRHSHSRHSTAQRRRSAPPPAPGTAPSCAAPRPGCRWPGPERPGRVRGERPTSQRHAERPACAGQVHLPQLPLR